MAFKNALRLQKEVLSIFEYMEPDLLNRGPAYSSLAVIPKMIDSIKATLELEAINIQINIETLAETVIPLSEQALEQILRELLNNSKKFHPQNNPKLELILSIVPDGVRLQICDDGLTLSPQQLDKMWVPYYQAEKYFSGQVPGMGLGLSMVVSTIWSVGGTCHAYNQPNGPGLIVELTLPPQTDNE